MADTCQLGVGKGHQGSGQNHRTDRGGLLPHATVPISHEPAGRWRLSPYDSRIPPTSGCEDTAEGWVVDGLHAIGAMARHMGNCGAVNYRAAIAFWNAVVVAYTTGNDTVFPARYEEWRSPIL